MPHKYPGKLIVFEGCEGAGKSTLIKAIAEALKFLDADFIETKEPYGEYRKRLLDTHPEIAPGPKEELDLFIRNRAEHFEELIIPSLKAGKIILCDRSSWSTIAYQHYGRGLDLTDILIKDAKARQNVDFDLVILLDIDPRVGLSRKASENRFEKEKIDFHCRVRDGYLELVRDDLDKKCVIIDASQPEEAVKNEALKAVLKLLRKNNLF